MRRIGTGCQTVVSEREFNLWALDPVRKATSMGLDRLGDKSSSCPLLAHVARTLASSSEGRVGRIRTPTFEGRVTLPSALE